MKTKAGKDQNTAEQSAGSNGQEFNFELWAKQVRPLLLASLSKRGNCC